MHYEGPFDDFWDQLSPVQLANVSVQRMENAQITIIPHDTQLWTFHRRALIIRKFHANLQRLIKIHITNNRKPSPSIMQLLVPYLILMANEKDFDLLCDKHVFDSNIIQYKDLSSIPIMSMLLNQYVINSLKEISNALLHCFHLVRSSNTKDKPTQHGRRSQPPLVANESYPLLSFTILYYNFYWTNVYGILIIFYNFTKDLAIC